MAADRLIINLSLLPFAAPHKAKYCRHYLGGRGETLERKILASSKVLADRSPSSLKTLRVIYPQHITWRNKAVDYVPEHRVAFISRLTCAGDSCLFLLIGLPVPSSKFRIHSE